MPLALMGCAIQFHIKPSRCKTWGSSDSWYLCTSPEHYRTHIVFVKSTCRTRISDTVYFKHKYLMQSTVTPANAIVKAYQDLMKVIQGIPNSKGTTHMEALQQLEQTLTPPQQSQKPVVPDLPCPSPRVATDPVPLPRVEAPRAVLPEPLPCRLIVESKPKPAIQLPTSESKASHVKARCQSQASEESIAEHVAWRCRKAAQPGLDQDTGDLLEYRALLRHPKFKDAWNESAANEFGWLAQSLKQGIKGTNTITFITKSEVPQDRFNDVTYT